MEIPPRTKCHFPGFCWSRSSPPAGMRHRGAEPASDGDELPGCLPLPLPVSSPLCWLSPGRVRAAPPSPSRCRPRSPQAARGTSLRHPWGLASSPSQWDQSPVGLIWASSPMGPPFASFGCGSLAGNDFWGGHGRNSPSGSSPTPLRHAGSRGTAGPSWHSLRSPAPTPALAALGAPLSPRRRIHGRCQGNRDGTCLGTRMALSWGRGRQTPGYPGNRDHKATASAPRCSPRSSCLLCSAEPAGSKCCRGPGAGDGAGRETREQLQCWEIRRRGDGCGSLSSRGRARAAVPAMGTRTRSRRGWGPPGWARRARCRELRVRGASAALPKLRPPCV